MSPSRFSSTVLTIVAIVLISIALLITGPLSKLRSVQNLKAPGFIFEKNKTPSKSEATVVSTGHLQDLESIKSESPYAFVAFLQDHYKHENKTDNDDDDYFVATRVLGYQLMHAPKTKSNSSIPFVVVCTPRVYDSKKERLAKDGAIIVDVDYVAKPDWIESDGGLKARWGTMMTKLRIFQLLQYEKILYADSDVLITDRLDGIFHDENATSHHTEHKFEAKEDAGRLPEEYTLAGQAQQHAWAHPYPPNPKEPLFGAGFFLTKPSQDLFDYYMHVLHYKTPRFQATYMEQSLLNYAHRRDGPMPWKALYYKWTTSYPTPDDLKAGARSMHHKFWWQDENPIENQVNELTTMWYQTRGEMEGYYRARDEIESAPT